jgi:hypothetical protein
MGAGQRIRVGRPFFWPLRRPEAVRRRRTGTRISLAKRLDAYLDLVSVFKVAGQTRVDPLSRASGDAGQTPRRYQVG